MIDIEEARRVILAACPVLPSTTVPLLDALGRVTTGVVVARHDVPSFANSAMDGYAVRAADTANAPAALDVVGTAAAGSAPGVEVGAGQAVRIMTGAVVPAGADAIVMVERTAPVEGHQDRVTIHVAASIGDHIRHPGEDLRTGQTLFDVGTELGPGHIGVLASVGATTVDVVPSARVGVLSTGDELVADGRPLRPGQIRDSNRPMLLSLLDRAGCVPVDLGTVPDDEEGIAAALREGVERCDAILTSGGVSVGDFDYVKAVLDRMGDMHWWQVAVRPAKPLAFGIVAGTPVFGLPGNPVSSLVSFELFARPALRQMMGHTALFRPPVPAIAEKAFPRRPDGRLHLLCVLASLDSEGRWHIRSSGGQGSHLLRTMALANALALLPDGDGVEQGASVQVLLLA